MCIRDSVGSHIERNLVRNTLRKIAADLLHLGLHRLGHLHCIGSRKHLDLQHGGITAVDTAFGIVGRCFERNARHVFQADDRTVGIDVYKRQAAPCMALEMKENEVFEFALELRRKNYPLSTISQWCLGKNTLKPRDFVNAIKEKKLPKAFENSAWYQRSINWYRVAQEKFSETFLAKKYLIGYIIDQGHEAKDPTAFYAQIEERIEQLTDEQAKLIMNPPKGLVTREQLIIDNLVEYLGR